MPKTSIQMQNKADINKSYPEVLASGSMINSSGNQY